jgi:hypothetical protein
MVTPSLYSRLGSQGSLELRLQDPAGTAQRGAAQRVSKCVEATMVHANVSLCLALTARGPSRLTYAAPLYHTAAHGVRMHVGWMTCEGQMEESRNIATSCTHMTCLSARLYLAVLS